MSIRIQNDQTAGVNSGAAERTNAVSGSTSSSGSRGANSIGGEDQVNVSSIGNALSAQSASRANRIQHLAALYASGNYHVDSARTSQAIVAGAIGSSSGTGKA
jgi:hypothetical protein